MPSILDRLDLRPIRPRDKHEPGRVASSLELFFDLVFVIAVGLAATNLHELESEQHLWAGVGAYLMVFFAIWWAWMNFTWFATAFDNDDWLYRVTTIVQMGGVLVLAAGVPGAMQHGNFTAVTFGYVIMRLAMVSQWVRVAVNSPEYRATALRYAGGITVVQLAWVLRLLLPDSLGVMSFIVLALAEITVPIWAEQKNVTPWHDHHIAERYGLFTLVVLGEGLLGSANAIIDGLQDADHVFTLTLLAACGLIITAAMWWIYFAVSQHDNFANLRQSLTTGYTHYIIFAAAGAVSAGIEVAVAVHSGATQLPTVEAGATLTIPVAVFVLAVWALAIRPGVGRVANTVIPIAGVLIGLCALAPWPEVVTSVLLIAVVVTLVVTKRPSPINRLTQAAGR
ncbi:low temperature requirement protein A [Subtercola lobariae]|uniref:Low temperature requirement protein A n=1 Tax=Subtercola lobariae TaxID=1588641 RepID=A0A917B5K7_9MICO|nr:low temperature requirement protein A [Subtercola lobariae]GGF21511.1 putative low temperature requirement protein A [Subtercola lobariae]